MHSTYCNSAVGWSDLKKNCRWAISAKLCLDPNSKISLLIVAQGLINVVCDLCSRGITVIKKAKVEQKLNLLFWFSFIMSKSIFPNWRVKKNKNVFSYNFV